MMAGAPVTVVLFDAEDARRFIATRPAAARVLTLTPDAHAALRSAGVAVVSSDQVYRAVSHQRALIRIGRASRRVLAACAGALAEYPAARTTLANAFHHYAATAVRAERTLLQGPWLFPSRDGWVRIGTRAEAVAALLRRLAGEPLFTPVGPPPLAALARMASTLCARIAAPSQPVLFSNIDKGFVQLAEAMAARKNAPRILSFRPATGRWQDLVRPFVALAALAAGRPAALTVVPAPLNTALEDAVRRALRGTGDPAIDTAMDLFGDELATLVVAADALARGAARLMAQARVRVHPTYSMRWQFDAALGEAAWRSGVPRPLVSHGTHPPAQNATGRAALAVLADGLLVSPMAEIGLVQTPHAEAAARAEMPALPLKRIQPLVWGHVAAPRPHRAGAGRFRILHAGTYKTWRSHRPWVYETSDEFVSGLVALAAAAAALGEAVELVIRIRPRAECALETLKQLLPDSANVRVKTSGSFLDDLAGADLLASYSSTTIEEALTQGVPVLLWGGGPPFRHLAARETPPARDDRAAVYAVPGAGALTEMLRAIAKAHRGRPLSKAETAPHVWQKPVWDREAVCDWLLGAAPMQDTAAARPVVRAAGRSETESRA